MPKLKPATQMQRRETILDAAETCFARTGFHRTTMQDICKTANVSPGALYVYFKSKEELIAGLCERERTTFDEKIKALQDAPDFLGALQKIAQHYFIQQSAEKRLVSVEMGVEATRNPKVAEICHKLEDNVAQAFLALFQRLKDTGRIAPELTIQEVTEVFLVMGDGLFWRRAVVPRFNAATVIPGLMFTLQALLKPVNQSRPVKPAPRSRSTKHDSPHLSASETARKAPSNPSKKKSEVSV